MEQIKSFPTPSTALTAYRFLTGKHSLQVHHSTFLNFIFQANSNANDTQTKTHQSKKKIHIN